MKKGIIATIAFMLLMSTSFNSFSNEERKSIIHTINFYDGMAEIEKDVNQDLEFYVSYLLDSDGKPYIISVKSKDEKMTQMVRKMIDLPFNENPISTGEWYSITFIYDNIQ